MSPLIKESPWRYVSPDQRVPWRYVSPDQRAPWRYVSPYQRVPWRYVSPDQRAPWSKSPLIKEPPDQRAPWSKSPLIKEPPYQRAPWRYVFFIKEPPEEIVFCIQSIHIMTCEGDFCILFAGERVVHDTSYQNGGCMFFLLELMPLIRMNTGCSFIRTWATNKNEYWVLLY